MLAVIVYYSAPFFKKFFYRKYNSIKTIDKANQRAIRRQEKLERKNKKKYEKNQKSNLNSKKSEVFTAQDSDFSENDKAIDLKEDDPDLRVDYKNFDYDGFFDKPLSSEQPSVDRKDVQENMIENNINQLFNEYFQDVKLDHDDKRETTDEKKYLDNDEFSNIDDEEIKDFLEEFSQINSGEDNSLINDFNKLSPEMKALFISNFLDRKDN